MSDVKATPSLTGTISVIGSLNGQLSGTSDRNPYTGDYEVVPSAVDDRILATASKVLSKDIVVKKIPYSETSNTADGTTVYIANPYG
ncbi:MAG: hypothetical protein Q4C65_02340 [Eubacteriales bacterium]|nr:hypothetical protein [Eubacteriales bacterium]